MIFFESIFVEILQQLEIILVEYSMFEMYYEIVNLGIVFIGFEVVDCKLFKDLDC